MDAIELLKSKQLKKTAQRIMLINILQKSSIPLTENDIKLEMGDLYDRITFYRTVQTLLEVDILHRITVDNITVKYALNDSPVSKCHLHFFCKKCHAVTCLDSTPDIKYNLPPDFKGEEYEILIKGTCNKCKKEATDA